MYPTFCWNTEFGFVFIDLNLECTRTCAIANQSVLNNKWNTTQICRLKDPKGNAVFVVLLLIFALTPTPIWAYLRSLLLTPADSR